MRRHCPRCISSSYTFLPLGVRHGEVEQSVAAAPPAGAQHAVLRAARGGARCHRRGDQALLPQTRPQAQSTRRAGDARLARAHSCTHTQLHAHMQLLAHTQPHACTEPHARTQLHAPPLHHTHSATAAHILALLTLVHLDRSDTTQIRTRESTRKCSIASRRPIQSSPTPRRAVFTTTSGHPLVGAMRTMRKMRTKTHSPLPAWLRRARTGLVPSLR